MQRRLIISLAALDLLISLTACSGQKGEHKPQLSPASPARAESKRETLVIDGMPTPITFKLFDSAKTTVPLKFTTYLPDDMISEVTSEREGDSVRFIANFGGKRDNDAFLELVVEVQGTTEYEARAHARIAAIAHGLVERPPDTPKNHAWSLSEYDFEGHGPKTKRIAGTIIFSRHSDHYFTFVLSYPEKDATQMRSRADQILSEWRWEDTGQGL